MSEREHDIPAIDEPDPDALNIVTVGVAGTIIAIVVVLFVQGLYERANRLELEHKIVADPPAEIRSLRAAQLTRLHTSAWVDKKNGYVTIPIEKAMELLIASPNPAAPIVLPGAAEDKPSK